MNKDEFKITSDGKELLTYSGKKRHIHIPEGITYICANSFRENNYIQKLWIPKSVEEIGANAFFKCKNLKEVWFEDGSCLKKIENWAFSDSSIETINLSKCKKLRIINTAAFERNNISTIDLSGCESLRNIGAGAFQKNKITKVIFSENIKSIGNFAFYRNIISEIVNFPNIKIIHKSSFAANKIKELDLSLTSCSIIEENAFANNLFGCFKEPAFLTKIHKGAFDMNPTKNIVLNILDNGLFIRTTGK